MEHLHLDPKYRRWIGIAERLSVFLVILIAGAWLGYMVGVQGSDARVAAADMRLVEERTDRLREIERMQQSYTTALEATARATQRVARQSERTAERVEAAVDKAEVAASTAKGAAARASRSAPTPAPAVNQSVREANRQLGAGK